jgi:hypothetical protein
VFRILTRKGACKNEGGDFSLQCVNFTSLQFLEIMGIAQHLCFLPWLMLLQLHKEISNKEDSWIMRFQTNHHRLPIATCIFRAFKAASVVDQDGYILRKHSSILAN